MNNNISNDLRKKVLDNFNSKRKELYDFVKGINSEEVKNYNSNLVQIYFVSFEGSLLDKAIFDISKDDFIELSIAVCKGDVITIEGMDGGFSKEIEFITIKL